uniref:Uncharacterized protein n=1 Tax=Tetranychus urticae TaxID=32264 RepID=T1KQA7_TETUR
MELKIGLQVPLISKLFSRPEDIVPPALKNIFEQTRLPGFSPEKTLQDNVAEFVKIVVDVADFCH